MIKIMLIIIDPLVVNVTQLLINLDIPDADPPRYALVPRHCRPAAHDHQLLWQVGKMINDYVRALWAGKCIWRVLISWHVQHPHISHLHKSWNLTAWVETTPSAWRSWTTTCTRSTSPRKVQIPCFPFLDQRSMFNPANTSRQESGCGGVW